MEESLLNKIKSIPGYINKHIKTASAISALSIAAMNSPAYSQISPSEATIISKDQVFCDFEDASISGISVGANGTFYTAPFTFNSSFMTGDDLTHLDSLLTDSPLIPNTLLVYFAPDTVSTQDRDNFENILQSQAPYVNRIINIPQHSDTLSLVTAVKDSVAGWVKEAMCGATSVGGSHIEVSTWGRVKHLYK